MLIHSPHELAVFLVRHRKKLKLTQRQVGDLVGLKQKTISAIENNPENIKLSTLFRVFAALEIEMRMIPRNEVVETNRQWDEEW